MGSLELVWGENMTLLGRNPGLTALTPVEMGIRRVWERTLSDCHFLLEQILEHEWFTENNVCISHTSLLYKISVSF